MLMAGCLWCLAGNAGKLGLQFGYFGRLDILAGYSSWLCCPVAMMAG